MIHIDDAKLGAVVAASDASHNNGSNGTNYTSLRAELDSHANMICLGKNCSILRWSHQTVTVNGFTSECGKLKHIPVVDAVIVYDDPYAEDPGNSTYFLVLYNALYVPSMTNHLIPPFVMREAGLIIDEVPKRQALKPDVDNHAIQHAESGLFIHLKLNGVFSYFDCRRISDDEMRDWSGCNVVHASPAVASWDPYNKMYAEEEEMFVDAHGYFRLPESPVRREHSRLLDDEDLSNHRWEHAAYASAVTKDEYDNTIDAAFAETSTMKEADPGVDGCLLEAVDDDLMRQVQACEGTLNENELAEALENLNLATSYAISAGSTAVLEDDELFVNDLRGIVDDAEATFSALATSPKGVTAERLAKLWRISEEDAHRTIETTTQLGRYSADRESLTRENPTDDRALRYKRFMDTVVYTDTMFVTKKATSTRGYTAVQVYVTDKGFVYCYLMTSINQNEYIQALRAFCREIGVMKTLVCDAHRTQTSAAARKFLNEVGTRLRVLERGTQWADLAERFIGLLKTGVRQDLRESNAPMVFWDYCLERRVQIMNLTARTTHRLKGLNPYTATTLESADISNIATFGWFDWVYCLEDKGSSRHGFPHGLEVLGRCLGPAKDHGNEMAQWVLKDTGHVVPLRTLRRLTPHELSVTNEDERDKRALFMNKIRQRFGDATHLPPEGVVELPTIEEESYEDLYMAWLDDPDVDASPPDDGEAEAVAVLVDEVSRLGRYHIPYADVCNAEGTPVIDQSLTDMMIGVEVMLPHGEERSAVCKVLRRSVDSEGKTTGIYDSNHNLNTMLYDVQFDDGTIQKYAANVIAQNVLEQVEDTDGHYADRIAAVVDHRRQGNAVSKGNRYVTTRDGQKKLRKSTAGWDFKVKFESGREQWMQLKDLKEVNPVEVAEYVAARGLVDEVAFQWWVPYTLRKKANIIASVKGRVVKRKTHKYGVQVPTSVEEAYALDRENGNTLWQDALKLEMGEIGKAVRFLPHGEQAPPGYIKASGHIIWDVKMDLRRKARWVKDGHLTPEPETSNYAGVVSRESVRIAFTYAALMGLPVMAGDIKNAYLQAPTSEKNYIVCGPEFGEANVGRNAVITGSIYGGRVAGRDYWLHLRKCMTSLGFKSSLGDPDVWFRPAVKSDGTEYNEYVLLYVDDVLVISENGEKVIREEIGRQWQFKESSIEKPTIYLGGKCREVTLCNGVVCWAFSSSQYVQEAVKNVEAWLKKKDRTLPKRAEAPFVPGYRPEVDVSRELGHDEASYYQSLIGILRWIVELGRVDISLEVSMMSSHLALPREGHLECLYHMFAYLKKYHNSEMIYDPTEPVIDQRAFKRADWTYSSLSEQDRTEVLPPNMPEPRGKGFVIRCYVDADHAGDSVTRKSRTGFIVYLNNAPVYWYSKRQGSVEPSTYQAEFTAMKEATEYIRGLRYRLRMMGIPVEGPAYIYGDNQSVLANTSNPGSMLKKKCSAVAYHLVREAVARGEIITAYISTHENIADLLTKPMPAGEKRNGFVRKILQHIFRSGS